MGHSPVTIAGARGDSSRLLWISHVEKTEASRCLVGPGLRTLSKRRIYTRLRHQLRRGTPARFGGQEIDCPLAPGLLIT